MSSDQFTMNDVYLAKEKWQALLIKDEMYQVTQFSQKKRLDLAYETAEHNAWIVRTLRDKKQRYRFPKCKNLVMIGSGIYPYSMFDVHKQYPHIRQVGLEIDEKRAIISRKLIEASPAKQSIKIGANVFWCQLGIHNESAAKLISENKIYYISNKCIKVEYERLFRKI